MGLTPPREGRVTIFGKQTVDWPTYRIAAQGVGYVPEGRRIFANLSVEENLKVPLQRDGPWTIERIYQLFPRLAERKLNRSRQLSGGEQEMLSIGRALLLNPKLLILDEPSQGLAPLIVREVFRVVAQMRAEGISVLLVEQNARMSLEIADHAYVLDDGAVVHSGSARELAADEARVQGLAGVSGDKWTMHENLGALSNVRFGSKADMCGANPKSTNFLLRDTRAEPGPPFSWQPHLARRKCSLATSRVSERTPRRDLFPTPHLSRKDLL